MSGLAIGVAALAATAQRGATPADRTAPVLVATHDLPAGARLHEGDVATARLPADQVPGGAFRGPAAVRGRAVAGPVRRGEPLTDRRLLGPALLRGYGPPGEPFVAAPVRVADAGAVRLLRPGDRIDVLAGAEHGVPSGVVPGGGLARVVASGARVVAVPPPRADAVGGSEGALVVLAVPRRVAVALAGAAASTRLSVTLR